MTKRAKKNGHAAPPNRLSEQDRLTLQCAVERAGRLQAHHQLLVQEANALYAEAKAALAAQEEK